MEVLWKKEGFQVRLKRCKSWALPDVLWEWIPNIGSKVSESAKAIQHFLHWPWSRPSSRVDWRIILDRPLWRVTCLNCVSFGLLAWVSRSSCGPRRKLLFLLHCPARSLVLCLRFTALGDKVQCLAGTESKTQTDDGETGDPFRHFPSITLYLVRKLL